MIQNTIGFCVLLLGLLSLSLQRFYSSIPLRELKRLAAQGDGTAQRLYRVAAYGRSARLLLWLILTASLSVGTWLIVPHLAWYAALGALFIVYGAAFVWLPTMQLTQRSVHFAAFFSPMLGWVLLHTRPVLDRLAAVLSSRRALTTHSRMYQKDDLLEVLERQKTQVGNRISHHELELARRALTFADKQAADIVQPRAKAHIVNADDTIGPVLLDQLHKQKQDSFLVYKDSRDTIVGLLAMTDAVRAKHGGRVLDLVRGDLTYVNEDASLPKVFDALQKAGQQLVVVRNGFDEFVGVITLQMLLQELFAEVKGSEQVTEPAPETAKTHHHQQVDNDQEPAFPEATEVVE